MHQHTILDRAVLTRVDLDYQCLRPAWQLDIDTGVGGIRVEALLEQLTLSPVSIRDDPNDTICPNLDGCFDRARETRCPRGHWIPNPCGRMEIN